MTPRFLKPSLREGFRPYTPGEQPPDGEGWVKLNTNESPLPPSPRVLEAIRAAVDGSLRLYPEPMSAPARMAIAAVLGLEPSQVALGNGGDELIAMAFRAFAGAGDSVAYPVPSYPLLEPTCHIHEVRPSPHPLTADWSLAPAFAADPAPLKFLVNPNSPTGTWIGRDEVRQVLESSNGVVVLDEAYVDFAPESRLDLLRDGYSNLLLLRSMSKSYALAGLRIGFVLGHPDLIASLDAVKDSYNLDRLAIVAAVAAIEDRAYYEKVVNQVVGERSWLADQLRALGFEVAPSATNFLFVRPPAGAAAEAVIEGLRERKILVRHYDRPPIEGWIRITISLREQHDALLQSLRAILGR
jgi:histidinol-phosphate aminotransferase